jgi:hypothetical protein
VCGLFLDGLLEHADEVRLFLGGKALASSQLCRNVVGTARSRPTVHERGTCRGRARRSLLEMGGAWG